MGLLFFQRRGLCTSSSSIPHCQCHHGRKRARNARLAARHHAQPAANRAAKVRQPHDAHPLVHVSFSSFPLMAITYTFGGVTITDLVLGVVFLIYTCLELGAFAILCSAFFRTTVEALCATYVGFPIFALAFPGACSTPPGWTSAGPRAAGTPSGRSPIGVGRPGLDWICHVFLLVACLTLSRKHPGQPGVRAVPQPPVAVFPLARSPL